MDLSSVHCHIVHSLVVIVDIGCFCCYGSAMQTLCLEYKSICIFIPGVTVILLICGCNG